MVDILQQSLPEPRMEEKLLEEGDLNSPKQSNRKPTIHRQISTKALRIPFVRRLVMIARKIYFVRQEPAVVKAVDVVARTFSRTMLGSLVRRVAKFAQSFTLRRMILFGCCASFIYLSGFMDVYRGQSASYEMYLHTNIEESVDTVAMADPKVVSLLKNRYLLPPPPGCHPSTPAQDGGFYRASRVYEFLKDKVGGFYLEYGPGVGETDSYSLALERTQNWTGLLIDPNPEKFELLRIKKRGAFLSQSCLSTQPYPTTTWIPVVSGLRTLAQWWAGLPGHPINQRTAAQIQCFPLFSFLLATKRLRVDFLSLDATGDELGVLQNIPWELVDIRVMAVKQYLYVVQGRTDVSRGRQVPVDKSILVKYLQGKDYKSYGDDSWLAPLTTTVTIFVKN